MTLKEKLDQDFKEAMKSKSPNYSTLSLIRAAIKQFEVDENKDPKDEEIINILKKEAKKRQESIDSFKTASRLDLVEKEEKELVIIKKYLPENMPESELRKIIEKIITENQATLKDLGKITGIIMKEIKGKTDGASVQKILKEILK